MNQTSHDMKMTMGENSNYDAFFFDMDGTLTKSKTEIECEHLKMLLKLVFKHPVIIVSGAVMSQMVKQLLISNVSYLSQNGNSAFSPTGGPMWQNTLSQDECDAINKHIEQIAPVMSVPFDSAHVQHRGCQVSFSLVGHDADLALKEKYDPTRGRRKALLQSFPFSHETLTVKIGGTTCLDYTRKDGTKGVNVQKYIDMYGFKNPVYVGDALFPGGNDESVKSVCTTVQVESVEETYDFINKYI